MFGFVKKRKDKQLNPDEITEKNLNQIVDFTLLKPTATIKELENFLSVAYKNRY